MKNAINEKQLKYMEFVQRETADRHHTNAEEMYQYELLKAGDPKAVEEGVRMFSSDLPGHLSNDPLRNYKYLFVAAITLACRSAIAGGMASERAFNISDLYIMKMDNLQTVDEVKALHADMFAFYTKEMAALDKTAVYSRPITQCLDYIYEHLHERIRVTDLAAHVGLNESYLSTLFKKSTGSSISEYILSKRMEAARNMLKFSDYSYAEISAILAFSSQSHFIRVFKKYVGQTPKEYRDMSK
ncbi:MAG: AraC family transcriptional regulator [Ruminococcus sp.]|nr:AraC family transcriptional regulator [Ruminococcus sp.]